MTKEEREDIINAAVEKALLLLPETMANLINEHMQALKLNERFYKDHPEFKEHKDIVQNVIEDMDGKYPLLKYDKLFDKAVPLIEESIKPIEPLHMKVETPDLEFKDILKTHDNGAL